MYCIVLFCIVLYLLRHTCLSLIAYRRQEWNPRTDSNPPTLPKSSQGIFNVPPPHRQGMTPELQLYVLFREDETRESKVSCLGTQCGGILSVQWDAVMWQKPVAHQNIWLPTQWTMAIKCGGTLGNFLYTFGCPYGSFVVSGYRTTRFPSTSLFSTSACSKITMI